MATGTFHTSRRGLSSEVVSLKDALVKGKLPRGTGYYIQDRETDIVYCMWKETHVVSVMSTCHPAGHQRENMVSRNCLGTAGKQTIMKFQGLLSLNNTISSW